MIRKKVKRKTILIDGIGYYDDKPDTCRKYFFRKNRKVGCVLGNLAEAVKSRKRNVRAAVTSKAIPESALSVTRNWTHGSEQSGLHRW